MAIKKRSVRVTHDSATKEVGLGSKYAKIHRIDCFSDGVADTSLIITITDNASQAIFATGSVDMDTAKYVRYVGPENAFQEDNSAAEAGDGAGMCLIAESPLTAVLTGSSGTGVEVLVDIYVEE